MSYVWMLLMLALLVLLVGCSTMAAPDTGRTIICRTLGEDRGWPAEYYLAPRCPR